MSRSAGSSKVLPLEKIDFPFIDPRSDELVYRNSLSRDLCQKTLSGTEYMAIGSDSNISQLAVDEHLQNLDSVIADLKWLLMLSHAKFWCQVINDDSVHALLNSYLRSAPRYKDAEMLSSLKERQNIVHRLVFLVFLRMSTPKESRQCFFTKEVFGEIIYDNFLFDIPRLMDICALYGNHQNIKLIRKMIDSVFQCQPKYNSDLQQAAKTVLDVLTHIEEKCSTHGSNDDRTSGPAVLEHGRPESHLRNMSDGDFEDLVLFLSDITHTLKAFMVDVYPLSAHAFSDAKLFSKMASLYCDSIKAIKKELLMRSEKIGEDLYDKLLTHIRLSREKMLTMVYHMIKNSLHDPSGEASLVTLSEKFISILSSILPHRLFLCKLQQKFDVKKDVENVLQACPDIEAAQGQYLLQALSQAVSRNGTTSENLALTNGISGTKEKPKKKLVKVKPERVKKEEEKRDEDMKMSLLISSVQELLPDLGAAFIEACLLRYDCDAEKVIQVVLDDNLPDDLQRMDRAASKSDSAPTQEDYPELPAAPPIHEEEEEENIPGSSRSSDFLSERRNVFDNDQFDFIKSDRAQLSSADGADRALIHRGKKERSEVVNHWSDEHEVARLRALYAKYDIVNDGSDEENFNVEADEVTTYDDEYDDTYDEVPVAANDLVAEDELLSRRNRNQRFRQESSSEEEDEQEKAEKSRLNFIVNPELIRAKQEERRHQRQADQQQRRGKRHQPEQRARAAPSSTTEGEDRDRRKKTQEVDRRRKEANKSSKANHNRKKLATRKAAKGM